MGRRLRVSRAHAARRWRNGPESARPDAEVVRRGTVDGKPFTMHCLGPHDWVLHAKSFRVDKNLYLRWSSGDADPARLLLFAEMIYGEVNVEQP